VCLPLDLDGAIFVIVRADYKPGFSVLLWIRVCHTLLLSGKSRILAYGSAVPLKSLACRS
jgi:hypothetical protein